MSIYEYICSQIGSDGFIHDSKCSLPDNSDLNLASTDFWVPGAYEGTLLRTEFDIKQNVVVNFHLARLFKKQVQNPSDARRVKLISAMSKYSAIAVVDPVISFLETFKIDKQLMREETLRILLKADKREAVKLAIAILGQCAVIDDLEILRNFAGHEEFSMYAVVALKKIVSGDEADQLFMEIADHLTGWGKLAVLMELDYTKPAVRNWGLRFGCMNDIGLSFSANICATKCRMITVLEDGSFINDETLFFGVCNIFDGLLEQHKTNDGINQYKDAANAITYFKKYTAESKYADNPRVSAIIEQLNNTKI